MVGPFFTIPINVKKEAGTERVWHCEENVPHREFFTFKISFLPICAALARHDVSVAQHVVVF